MFRAEIKDKLIIHSRASAQTTSRQITSQRGRIGEEPGDWLQKVKK